MLCSSKNTHLVYKSNTLISIFFLWQFGLLLPLLCFIPTDVRLELLVVSQNQNVTHKEIQVHGLLDADVAAENARVFGVLYVTRSWNHAKSLAQQFIGTEVSGFRFQADTHLGHQEENNK